MTIKYGFGAISDTGGNTVTAAGQMKTIFEDLMTKAKAILAEDWNGAAADAFDKAQARWDVQANALGEAQLRTGQLTTQASEDMLATDLRASNLFN
ncbi:WXG100 family type VII secretion target [Saccharopolyspora antimicrobica]|uniref:WXG100 family type VII secretion target n=1 Tax=Saccharopolyspora antimicrobica TaxID=455193 RepID=A0A1I5G5E6_9PSEU|nr:WXG100 family type VII secretion target [Saccharopolyspora antimicrobica]RKT83919.1 WXG100 family type VII secretion target [Saccharopolyspora antimicrobica]SFO31172.1 WXG100 family type VII secretion target [Saccharopolyspora antimicrobica]